MIMTTWNLNFCALLPLAGKIDFSGLIYSDCENSFGKTARTHSVFIRRIVCMYIVLYHDVHDAKCPRTYTGHFFKVFYSPCMIRTDKRGSRNIQCCYNHQF